MLTMVLDVMNAIKLTVEYDSGLPSLLIIIVIVVLIVFMQLVGGQAFGGSSKSSNRPRCK